MLQADSTKVDKVDEESLRVETLYRRLGVSFDQGCTVLMWSLQLLEELVERLKVLENKVLEDKIDGKEREENE